MVDLSLCLTLSNAEFDLQINGSGHHRLGEDQDVLQADHHHQIRKDLTAERKTAAVTASGRRSEPEKNCYEVKQFIISVRQFRIQSNQNTIM